MFLKAAGRRLCIFLLKYCRMKTPYPPSIQTRYHLRTYKLQQVNKHHQHSPQQKQTKLEREPKKLALHLVSQNTNNSRNQNIGGQIVVIPCGNMRNAEVLTNSPKITDPLWILIHAGENDFDYYYPEDIANNLGAIAKKFQEKFRCNVYLSDITSQNY